MRYNSLILFLMLSFYTSAQNPLSSSTDIALGRSIHGTGDLAGYYLGFQFDTPITSILYWSLGIEATLNDAPDLPLFYEEPNGNIQNGTLHFVTNGLQLIGGVGFKFINSEKHILGVSLNPLFRYQATSISDRIGTIYPAGTGLPVPVRVIESETPYRTYSVGASLKLKYQYQLNEKWQMGLMGGVQSDTNGDTIFYYGLQIGRKYL
ncbi:hypothetical protein [Cellulophaga algicola]|nr:hypothetical protein [Cellulophaga algicola]